MIAPPATANPATTAYIKILEDTTPHNPRGGPAECWLIQFAITDERSADA